jgi:hypothetical protein
MENPWMGENLMGKILLDTIRKEDQLMEAMLRIQKTSFHRQERLILLLAQYVMKEGKVDPIGGGGGTLEGLIDAVEIEAAERNLNFDPTDAVRRILQKHWEG